MKDTTAEATGGSCLPIRHSEWDYVNDLDALQRVLERVAGRPCALDFETVGFSPDVGRVRSAQLYNDEVEAFIDFDGIDGGFRACAHLFESGAWIVFNAGFEQRWFLDAGVTTTCWDVGYLRRAIMGGGRYSLADICLWDLDVEMSKEMQTSNWDAPELSDAQIEYALDDSYYTWALWLHWRAQADDGHMDCFNLLNDMVPAVIEMEQAGMLIDVDQHKRLVDHWTEIQLSLINRIRISVSEDDVANLNSRPQWSDWLARSLPDDWLEAWPKTGKTGQLSQSTEDLRLMAAAAGGRDHPLGALLLTYADYTKISKYISSFGEGVINKATGEADGRVRARFNIAAAKTCRFSSSGPNLQQIPRDLELLGEETSVRSSFVAPERRLLVSLDYSGIELRVLALLADDEQLLHDCVHGDVHSEVASYWAGRPIDKANTADKRLRSRAKGVSFGIIYGSSAVGLQATMGCDFDTAQQLLDYWASRYKRAFEYRDVVMREARETGFIRMVDGGTIWMGSKPELPKCANYPVQRAALSVMAGAIVRHKDTLDDLRASDVLRAPDACRMLATIHDALIDEVHEDDAWMILRAMQEDMTAAYLDTFPGAPVDRLVEGGAGRDWGHLEELEL